MEDMTGSPVSTTGAEAYHRVNCSDSGQRVGGFGRVRPTTTSVVPTESVWEDEQTTAIDTTATQTPEE